MPIHTLQIILIASLSVAAFVSLYIFICAFLFKQKKYIHIFNTWQCPMIVAILIEAIYLYGNA